MLLKTFKYDFLSIFKLWVIAAIASVAGGAMSGVCFRIIDAYVPKMSSPVQGTMVESMLTILAYTCLIVIVAFAILSIVITTVRFYTSLFTDQGYLTFTLPVKRKVILNAKMLNLAAYTVMTLTVVATSLIVLAAIAPDTLSFNLAMRSPNLLTQILSDFLTLNKAFFDAGAENGIGFVVCELLVATILILTLFFTPMMIHTALTIGATLVKRAKVAVGIAIYYGCQTVLELVLYGAFLGGLFCVEGVFLIESALNYNWEIWMFIIAILLAIIAFLVCSFGLMYTIMHRCLKNRLNLA